MSEITINKSVQFGRPCIADTGIPTEIVYERYQAGETVATLAWDYGMSVNQILAAINYEKCGRQNEQT